VTRLILPLDLRIGPPLALLLVLEERSQHLYTEHGLCLLERHAHRPALREASASHPDVHRLGDLGSLPGQGHEEVIGLPVGTRIIRRQGVDELDELRGCCLRRGPLWKAGGEDVRVIGAVQHAREGGRHLGAVRPRDGLNEVRGPDAIGHRGFDELIDVRLLGHGHVQAVESLRDPEFTMDVEQFVARLDDAACVNSLAQTLIKLTAPGVPDIYQGNETRDFSLVDPDNRRPVDFESRRQSLEEIKKLPVEKIMERHGEGLPKMWLIRKTLKLRARKKKLFDGGYEPLFARGEKAKHAVAFMRGDGVITIVPRLVLGLKNWGGTFVKLPRGRWHNEFTGETFAGFARLSELLKKFPVALLVRKENG